MISIASMVMTRDTILAAAFILFVFFAFFQLLSRKYVGKAKSILPPDLEAKRIKIATRHNQLVGVMLLAVLTLLFSSVAIFRHNSRWWTVLAIVLVGAAEIAALRRLFKYDKQMCEQHGFMCPHCQKPLYEPRSFINLNGQCPKCKQSILTEVQRSPALA
jgi:hypothetical protein